MTWVRTGDNAANHPVVLAPLEREDCDDRLVNEVFGFVMLCAHQSAAHLTDYVVTKAAAISLGGSRKRAAYLIDVAIEAGYFTPIEVDGRSAFQLINDPEFIHLRLKDEVDWERQRKRDNNNPALTVPVRLRDGDGCRWCGVIVNWSDRKGGRGGTIDHLEPQHRATVDTAVVACKSCNSSRQDGSTPRGMRDLLPEPEDPYYSESTVEWLQGNKWRERHGLAVPATSRRSVGLNGRAEGSQPGQSPATSNNAPPPAKESVDNQLISADGRGISADSARSGQATDYPGNDSRGRDSRGGTGSGSGLGRDGSRAPSEPRPGSRRRRTRSRGRRRNKQDEPVGTSSPATEESQA